MKIFPFRYLAIVAMMCCFCLPVFSGQDSFSLIGPSQAQASTTGAASSTAWTLTIQTDIDSRDFLIDTNQMVIVTSSSVSQDDTVVVLQAFQPLADQTVIIIKSNPILYVSNFPVSLFGTVSMSLETNISYGQAYAFNGTQIVGDGSTVSGLSTLYYDAPSSTVDPITTGLAVDLNFNGASSDKMAIANYYNLARFQTQVFPQLSGSVLVFVAGNVVVGEALPIAILTPAPTSGSAFPTAISDPGALSTSGANLPIQIGRYLYVDLNTSQQSTIHFDQSENAFAYGPYSQ